MSHLRRGGSSLEGVQTLLLCALRDQGKGAESQAWLLLGLAVRMGQDLGMHSDSTVSSRTGNWQENEKYSLEELRMRQRVWGVTQILDLFLSLQLGRPPGIVDRQMFSDWPSYTLTSTSATAPNLIFNPECSSMVFAHIISVSRIISRINRYLYLGFSGYSGSNTTGLDKSSGILVTLAGELDMWHQSLPVELRISIGHQPTREVIELNMLYHVAIILLYRPL